MNLSSFLPLFCLSAVVLAVTNITVDRPPMFFCFMLPCARGIISLENKANGAHIGYISNTYPNHPNQGAAHYLLTTSISDALVVVLPSTNIRFNLARNSFNILAVNPANSEWNYLGAAASIVGQNLEQAPSLALITGTKVIPVGPPQTAPAVQEISDSTFLGESQIWFLGCLRQFFSTWVNPDGTTSQPTYFYYPPDVGNQDGLIGMAVNIAPISPQAIPVTFTFIPQFTCALPMSGSSRKRASETTESSQKIQKIHPFFTKGQDKAPAQQGTFQWLSPLGPNRSCLHGINLHPTASCKVAALDLDGTIISSAHRGKVVEGKPLWEWWRSFVPDKLKTLIEEGYSIVIVTNQGIKPAALKAWKDMIPLIGEALKEIPFRLMAATQKDQYRKPMPGIWLEIERIFREEGVTIDKSASFFVGDAAGRKYPGGKADFSSTDRKWAENVGLRFFTPEEYFLKLAPYKNFELPGFRPSSLGQGSQITPTSTPILPDPPRQEVVLFVGYPCLGKSTLYRQHFKAAGYVHVNQDTLKTREKCVKAVEEALKSGQSCVVDNTNRDIATRKFYVDICAKLTIPIRCFHFADTLDLAWHNNLYRAFNLPPSVAENEPKRDLIPYSAFFSFRNSYEEPTLNEGFSEIKKVHWIFQGTEEESRYWSMWLQLDGK